MLKRYKKKYCQALPGKITRLFLLLLLPAFVQAQVDSTILADSLPPGINVAPNEDPQPAEERQDPEESATDPDHFFSVSDFPEDSSIVQRKVSESDVKKMQQDDDFWYANTEIKKKKPEEIKSGYIPLGQQKWFQTLLWLVIIGGFAAAIMWYLAGSNVGLFRRKDKSLKNTGEDELATEDIFAIQYRKEIEKAEANGNYRLAIRLMFLRLLKDMSEKNIIQYKQDRTNLEYLMQVQPTGFYHHFFRITRNYEYSWYGQFDVGEDTYSMIKKDFIRFDRQLS